MKNGGIITANNRVKANFNEQMRKIVCAEVLTIRRVGAIKGSAVLQNIMRETVIGHCSNNSPGHCSNLYCRLLLLCIPRPFMNIKKTSKVLNKALYYPIILFYWITLYFCMQCVY